jgi:ABC-2 type transport system ATP-binding protein
MIAVEGLCKSYGEIRALVKVGFRVREGEIFGYLGPNGAGKTTTINVLCGLLPRDEGKVSICDLDIEQDPVGVKEQIGVVPEESNLYPELTCRRNLEYLGELYGLPNSIRRARARELIETFELTDRAEDRFRALSRGMKRRLVIAAALVHSPPVIFLDEPTAGLDVPSARALMSLIRSINSDGTTVFLTTHNLAVAEALCNRILILVQGHVVTEGTAREIRQKVAKPGILFVVLSGAVDEESLRKACPAAKSAKAVDGKWRLETSDVHTAVAQITAFAAARALRILEINSEITSLEDAFMTILDDKSRKPDTDK